MGRRIWSWGFLVAMVAVGCAPSKLMAPQVPAEPAVQRPEPLDETALGRALASGVLERYALHRDSSLTRYVNLVGSAVALHSDRPEIFYVFTVLDTPEPRTFSLPGGYVFITRGMLGFLEDEADLAGVLGHAVAHVAQEHTRDITLQRVLDGFMVQQEMEADRLATLYVRRVGYDPHGLRDVLRRLAQAPTADPATIRVRLTRLEGFLSATGLAYVQGPRLADRFQRYVSRQ